MRHSSIPGSSTQNRGILFRPIGLIKYLAFSAGLSHFCLQVANKNILRVSELQERISWFVPPRKVCRHLAHLHKYTKIPERVFWDFCVFVDMGRETFNTLKIYLAGFWSYYQSSPALQKALANAWLTTCRESTCKVLNQANQILLFAMRKYLQSGRVGCVCLAQFFATHIATR